MQFSKISSEIFQKIQNLLGATNVIVDKEKMYDYSHDEFAALSHTYFPEVVVKPKNTGEVSELVKLANREHVPITPRGGGTGLCGGCVPIFGGMVLSLERMNRVVEVDRQNLMAVAEAGVPLEQFYHAIEAEGLFFPPHPGDESATIGGVIATNAGGARAVKYGVIRNFVRGIEVVLPTGEITRIGGKLIKNSSGYSLLHLMIGSEGTLGIITEATLNLYPPPEMLATLVVPFATLHDAIETVPAILQNKIIPMAVEFVDQESLQITEEHLHKKWPCPNGKAHLMVILDASQEDELMQLAEKVSAICEEHNALDVVIAMDKQKQRNILEIRSKIYEAMRNAMVEILDLTIPRASIAAFVNAVDDLSQRYGMWCPTYGHAADGNVHTHIMKARFVQGAWQITPGWEEKYPKLRKEIHELGHEFHGMVSGEHGIGLVKKEYMPGFLDAAQLQVMRNIKATLDPNWVLNPGKIFDPKEKV